MFITFLLGKVPIIRAPNTLKNLEGVFHFDDCSFSGLVEGLENMPKSIYMFKALYEECNSILYHNGDFCDFLKLKPSILIEEDGIYDLELHREDSLFFDDHLINLEYRTQKKDRFWSMYATRRDGEFVPCGLKCFDDNLDLIFENCYLN